MSIIGTRPPLISETNLYELHHRARLAIKPGMDYNRTKNKRIRKKTC